MSWGATFWSPATWGDRERPRGGAYLSSLLPRGRAWTRAVGSNLQLLLDGLGYEFDRVLQRGVDLLAESDPRTATETIDDWERVLGLPDPCDNPPTALDDRRAAAHAKYISGARQDPQFYIDVSAALGYTVTVSRFSAFKCNSPCNAGLHYGEWAHAIQVTGSSGALDAALQCRLDSLKQAHGHAVLNLT